MWNDALGRTAAIVLGSLAACGPSDEEVALLVDRRLAEQGLLPSASAGAASASAAPASSTADAAASEAERLTGASLDFLARLDGVMDGYEPALPAEEDKTDALRCVTTYAASTGKGLEGAAGKVAAARAQADRARRTLRDEVRPLNYRIDLDWKTRGSKRAAEYGCWAFTPSGSLEPSWMTWRDSEESCAAGAVTTGARTFGVQTQWRVRVPEGAFVYTYSRTTEPPKEPPELMARMAAAGLEPPARLGCRVEDVTQFGSHAVVKCAGSAGTPPLIRISGDVPVINVGDAVSAPVAATRRDPGGVLLLWERTVRGRKGAVVRQDPAWTVDADGAAVKVEEQASCPTVEQIKAALTPEG